MLKLIPFTHKERMFLSVSTNGYFAIDFSIKEKYKFLEIWVERYENGKKVSSVVKTSTVLCKCKEGTNLITVATEATNVVKENRFSKGKVCPHCGHGKKRGQFIWRQ